jgi:hypothetical protein
VEPEALHQQLSNFGNNYRLIRAGRVCLLQIEKHLSKITAKFGLDTVNIGGVSGDGLLDTPQDVLLQKEEDAILAQEGGAYGVSDLRAY